MVSKVLRYFDPYSMLVEILMSPWFSSMPFFFFFFFFFLGPMPLSRLLWLCEILLLYRLLSRDLVVSDFTLLS